VQGFDKGAILQRHPVERGRGVGQCERPRMGGGGVGHHRRPVERGGGSAIIERPETIFARTSLMDDPKYLSFYAARAAYAPLLIRTLVTYILFAPLAHLLSNEWTAAQHNLTNKTIRQTR